MKPAERKRLTVLRREGIINGGRSRQGQDVMNTSVTMKSVVRSSVCSDDQFDYKCSFFLYLKNCFNFFKLVIFLCLLTPNLSDFPQSYKVLKYPIFPPNTHTQTE